MNNTDYYNNTDIKFYQQNTNKRNLNQSAAQFKQINVDQTL